MSNKRKPDAYVEDRILAFMNVCHKKGLKITPQRVAIYRQLLISKDHPTATEIYRQIRTAYPHISLGTVNSSLLTLEEKGIIYAIGASGDPKRFEGNMEHRYHLRCLICRKVVDLEGGIKADISISEDIKIKYRISGSKVLLEGVCDKCR